MQGRRCRLCGALRRELRIFPGNRRVDHGKSRTVAIVHSNRNRCASCTIAKAAAGIATFFEARERCCGKSVHVSARLAPKKNPS